MGSIYRFFPGVKRRKRRLTFRQQLMICVTAGLIIGSLIRVPDMAPPPKPGVASAPATPPRVTSKWATAPEYVAPRANSFDGPLPWSEEEAAPRPSATSNTSAASSVDEEMTNARFGSCHSGGGYNCVVDGDTAWISGEKIRIADIDAPETHPANCAEEQRLGDMATMRLRDLLNEAPISLAAVDRDTDRYGRKLRVIMQNGRSVGDILVSEGLARRWEGYRRPWC